MSISNEMDKNYVYGNDTFRVVGTGIFLPERVVTAADLDRKIGKASGWTARHTGVLERRWVSRQTQSEMGAAAGLMALKDANLELNDVDLLISASGTPEQLIPCNAARILSKLDAKATHIAAYDMNATCLSFLIAFDHAVQLLRTHRASCVLIVSSEIASSGLDFSDPGSAALMGDGAVAIVVKKQAKASCIVSFEMQTFPEGVEMAELRGGGSLLHPSKNTFQHQDYLFKMDGAKLFKLVSRHLRTQVERVMNRHSVEWKDIKAIVAHQASGPAVNLLCKRLRIPEKKLIKIYAKYGNTIAASIPMALHELRNQTVLKKADKVLFIGTSAGVSIATLLLEW